MYECITTTATAKAATTTTAVIEVAAKIVHSQLRPASLILLGY